MDRKKTLIFIPTYNEAANVEALYRQIRELNLGADLLFLDDNSPDGTGKIIDRLAEEDPAVYVIHREKKSGIGSAHLRGIAWAYERQYVNLITMDCDFSHSPQYMTEFLRYAPDHDIVIGSRHLKEGSLAGWSIVRKLLTRLGHFLTCKALNLPYDATGAYRLYRLDRIPKEIFTLIKSQGYSFFFESLYALHVNNFSVKEFPIHLPSRTYGESKMKWKDIVQSLKRLISLFFLTRKQKYQLPAAAPAQSQPPPEERVVKEGGSWDLYWSKKNGAGAAAYDGIAAFYRKFIIKPFLRFFVLKYFATNANVLHAGCGSGQVDEDLHRHVRITAMDISKPALELYRKFNGKEPVTLEGDILAMPFEDGAFDGIYNLGVMEHFSDEEIRKILNEFRRVLRPGGTILLFWPPEFGLSVNVLKCVHYVFNRVLKKNVMLHPPEINRIQSRGQVKEVCERNGLRLVDYYFGPRDLFTQSVVVLKKDDT
ncbi:MAG: glycosyltransferase [Candidatus Omnitrophota bacterium]